MGGRRNASMRDISHAMVKALRFGGLDAGGDGWVQIGDLHRHLLANSKVHPCERDILATITWSNRGDEFYFHRTWRDGVLWVACIDSRRSQAAQALEAASQHDEDRDDDADVKTEGHADTDAEDAGADMGHESDRDPGVYAQPVFTRPTSTKTESQIDEEQRAAKAEIEDPADPHVAPRRRQKGKGKSKKGRTLQRQAGTGTLKFAWRPKGTGKKGRTLQRQAKAHGAGAAPSQRAGACAGARAGASLALLMPKARSLAPEAHARVPPLHAQVPPSHARAHAQVLPGPLRLHAQAPPSHAQAHAQATPSHVAQAPTALRFNHPLLDAQATPKMPGVYHRSSPAQPTQPGPVPAAAKAHAQVQAQVSPVDAAAFARAVNRHKQLFGR